MVSVAGAAAAALVSLAVVACVFPEAELIGGASTGGGSTGGGTTGGGGAGGAACSGADGGWPDSATPLCTDGTSEVDCASAPGQDGNSVTQPDYVVDAVPGTIIDPVTGLTWERNYAGGTLVQGSDACSSLGGDWRLPTRIELTSILDYGTSGPSVDATLFFVGNDGLDSFWSTTVGGEGAWVVDLGTGIASTAAVGETRRFRCVSGQLAAACFVETADTISDYRTGLEWRTTLEDAAPWSSALTSCGAGWRLPTIKELLTIVDDSGDLPPRFAFLDGVTLWSSTPFAAGYANAWQLDFSLGANLVIDVDISAPYACVR